MTLVILPLHEAQPGLRAAVVRLRRSIRDARDRVAKTKPRWQPVALAGMVAGDRRAFVLVRHVGIARTEIADVLCRRWPGMVITNAEARTPSWRFSADDAAELAGIGRGVEPLRIVVLPQRRADAPRFRHTAAPTICIEPLPTII